jgi:hypothetical protein
LERDRAAVLTVRSAVNGIVDYREADILDRGWWRRWRILLNEMTSQADKELIEHLYSYHLALVSNSGLTEDSFKSTQKSARNNFEELMSAARPWTGRSVEERLDQESDQIKEDWKYFFGWDMDNPGEVSAYIKEREEMAKKHAEEEARKVSEEFEGETRMIATQERVRKRRAKAYRSGDK